MLKITRRDLCKSLLGGGIGGVVLTSAGIPYKVKSKGTIYIQNTHFAPGAWSMWRDSLNPDMNVVVTGCTIEGDKMEKIA